ncbi:hypothetical protein O181_099689 [Austropuccinia psidii MF-1]|uniref:Uncharacterized protein n=1 Tax=Austropuccinia psidii MF-1 TaxID=1389203 RepID=A0A9Q3JDR8_9BASI|nr:hypothetical protein [Austropuccinia psidii MF-1]
MGKKRFKLASHWAELEASFQRICLKEIPVKDLMVITKRWNPNRKFKLLQERETRIRENQATIQAIDKQVSQKEPTPIPSGSQGVDQPSSPVASHHSQKEWKFVELQSLKIVMSQERQKMKQNS